MTPLGIGSEEGAASVTSTPFVVHRRANPRYRPPLATAVPIGPSSASRLRALDRFTAQIFQHGLAGAGSTTHWQITAGEQSGNDDALELFAAGGQREGRSALEALRVSGRRGRLFGGLGDQEPLGFGRLASLSRLRGGHFRYGTSEAGVLAFAGMPSPVFGQTSPRLAFGGLAIEGVRYDEAILSLTGIAFAKAWTSSATALDARGGRGGLGSFGWRAPVGRGWLSQRLGGQLHDLEGPLKIALQHELQWSFVSPRFAATLASERNTSGARVLATERLAESPHSEDRWSLQARSASGRCETHSIGVVRKGGDASLEARTIGWGASGSFGRSAWYGGTDAVWDTRAGRTERRFGAQVGRALAGATALLARVEYGERPGAQSSVAALGEASLSLPRSVRLELEPRLGWGEGVLQHGQITTRVGCPLGPGGMRVTGSIAVGATREQRFQGGLQEAALALSCSPRLRDRADIEARRMEQGGKPAMEYSARYDAMIQRYENSADWMAARDTGRVTVLVGRSGNGSGVPDVLVSLDGRLLRFTDADGIARFDRVPPGVHTVAIEERSLGENVELSGASRVFVTVERGRVPEPVRFTIARMERRTKF